MNRNEGDSFSIRSFGTEMRTVFKAVEGGGRIPETVNTTGAEKTEAASSEPSPQNAGAARQGDDHGAVITNMRIYNKFYEYVDSSLFNQAAFRESIKQAVKNANTSIWSILKKVEDEEDTSDEELTCMLVALMKMESSFTYEHCQRVMEWSVSLAGAMGLEPEQCEGIKRGAFFRDIGKTGMFYDEMNEDQHNEIAQFFKKEINAFRICGEFHDVGKIKIPPEILNKASKLTEEEFEIMKQHPVIGESMLRPIRALHSILPAVRHHHERWDGTGYPDGLAGRTIPVEARIIAVTDTFDAMTADRPYRKALSAEEAIRELKKNSGTQFDPEVVGKFLSILENESAGI